MNIKAKIAALTLLIVGSLACGLPTASPLVTVTVQAPPAMDTEQPATTTVAEQPSATPVVDVAQSSESVSLDPCTLVTAAEAEAIFGQTSGPASPMGGACAYSNASDSLYMVSAAAAQDQETSGILQGQMMMLGLGGVQLDEARVNKLRSLAQGLDYKGFFSELVAISQGAPTMTARLVDNSGNDLAYWVWVNAQSRRQGSFVAVRGQTLVNINLIVPDTQAEDAMLAAATSLADQVFERLPSKFTLSIPATQAPPPTATIVVKTIAGTWERHSSDVTERLVFNADGTYSIEARKNSTNAIIVSNGGTFTYDNSTIQYVDKNKKKTSETYTLSDDGNVLVINNQTDRAWTRIE